MSFVKLNSSNFATNSIILNPTRKYVSCSSGITGALKIIVNRSETQKDNIDMREGIDGYDRTQLFSEYTYEGRRIAIFETLNSELNTAKENGLWLC